MGMYTRRQGRPCTTLSIHTHSGSEAADSTPNQVNEHGIIIIIIIIISNQSSRHFLTAREPRARAMYYSRAAALIVHASEYTNEWTIGWTDKPARIY